VRQWELEKEKGEGVVRCEKGMRRRVTIGGVVQCGDEQQRVSGRMTDGLEHCKKSLAVFPSPAGMSQTKLSLAGNN
jgi:hypothetical protein